MTQRFYRINYLTTVSHLHDHQKQINQQVVIDKHYI